MPMELFVGDRIRTRKQHPCGNDIWTIIRVGADIKIKCEQCGRIVMLEREICEKRIKAMISRGTAPETTPII